jgi:hypothetical protein
MKLIFAPKSMQNLVLLLVNFVWKKFSPYYWFCALLGSNWLNTPPNHGTLSSYWLQISFENFHCLHHLLMFGLGGNFKYMVIITMNHHAKILKGLLINKMKCKLQRESMSKGPFKSCASSQVSNSQAT